VTNTAIGIYAGKERVTRRRRGLFRRRAVIREVQLSEHNELPVQADLEADGGQAGVAVSVLAGSAGSGAGFPCLIARQLSAPTPRRIIGNTIVCRMAVT
jgi:hypothetical protein